MSEKPVAWTNPLAAVRTIRACEGEAAAQLRLEDYALSVRALAIAESIRACENIGKDIVCPEECAEAIRALSSPPSVSEEWVDKRIDEALSATGNLGLRAAVRATLAALGVTVEGATK